MNKSDIAVGEDPNQDAIILRDRYAADVVGGYDRFGFLQRTVGRQCDWLNDHPGLGHFNFVNFGGPVTRREVSVEAYQPALPGKRDRQAGLGNGIHGSGDQREMGIDFWGELNRSIHIAGEHLAVAWDNQYIIEGQGGFGVEKCLIRFLSSVLTWFSEANLLTTAQILIWHRGWLRRVRGYSQYVRKHPWRQPALFWISKQ